MIRSLCLALSILTSAVVAADSAPIACKKGSKDQASGITIESAAKKYLVIGMPKAITAITAICDAGGTKLAAEIEMVDEAGEHFAKVYLTDAAPEKIIIRYQGAKP